MIEKTEALVLRVTPFSRTSHIVTWLTPYHGKLTTIIKGASRPKSQFLGQYDLFYTCELLFYSRERNALHIAKECSPLKTRSTFRTNWRAAFCASYVCDLVLRVSPERHRQPELYQLAVSSMDFLSAETPGPQFLFWFELKLMKALGLAPQLVRCPACRGNINSQPSRHSLFSCVGGGILCPECARRHAGSTVTISPDILAMLRSWQNAHSPHTAQRTRCASEQLLAFRKLFGMFLSYHLDMMMPISRNIAIEMIMNNPRPSA